MGIFRLIATISCLYAAVSYGQAIPIPFGSNSTSVTTYATYDATYHGTTATIYGSPVLSMSVTPTNGVACASIGASTTGKSTGKYSWEIQWVTGGGNSSIGVTNSMTTMNLNTFMGADSHGWSYYSNGGGSGGNWQAGSLTFGWTNYTIGDWIHVELDAGGNTVSFYKLITGTKTLIGTLTLSGGNYLPANSTNTGSFLANYGQGGAFQMAVSAGYQTGFF